MIEVKQNDRRPHAPAIIMRGTEIVPLTDATSVTFRMRRMNMVDILIEAPAHVVDAAAGEVEYQWSDGDTATCGQFYADWRVVWSDGTAETFPTRGFDPVVIYEDLDGAA